MGEENLYEMRLYRRGTDSNGCEKGVLIFFPPTGEPYYFTTRERGHGYPSIPIGTYIIEHSMKNNESPSCVQNPPSRVALRRWRWR